MVNSLHIKKTNNLSYKLYFYKIDKKKVEENKIME